MLISKPSKMMMGFPGTPFSSSPPAADLHSPSPLLLPANCRVPLSSWKIGIGEEIDLVHKEVLGE